MGENHSKFLSRIWQLDERLRRKVSKTARYQTGYVPKTMDYFLRHFEDLLEGGIIKPGDNFFDFGSGAGFNLAAASYLGLSAYGIEINEDVFPFSQKFIQALKKEGYISDNTVCKAVLGNYFLDEYIDLRESGGSVVDKHEMSDYYQDYYNSNLKIFFPQANDKDIYSELGIQFNEIDVFWAYTWQNELPAILEMFSLYAKDGAIFVNETANYPLKMNSLVEKLNLGESSSGFSAYVKIFRKNNGVAKVKVA